MPPSLATWSAGLPRSPSGVPYAESARQDEPSPIEEIRRDGARAVISVDVPWDKRQAIEKDWLEWAVVLGGANRFVSRNVPRAFPGRTSNIANRPYLFAKEFQRWIGQAPPDTTAGQPGRTGSTQIPTPWMLARGSLLFEDRTYAADAGGILSDAAMIAGGYVDANGNPDESCLRRYVTRRLRPGGQNLPLPIGSFKLVGGVSTTVPGQPGIREPNYRLTLTWHGVPEKAVGIWLINPSLSGNGAIDLALGRVNKTAFPPTASGLPQAPIGTLLLESVDPVPLVDALGDRVYDLVYQMAYFHPLANSFGNGAGLDKNSHPIGHQHLLDKDAQYYEVCTSSVTSNFGTFTDRTNPYDWAEFANLFRSA